MPMPRHVLTIPFLCLSWFAGTAQQQSIYTYQQLSNTYYSSQKDSLKKAWVCPDVYSDRAVQKQLREIWDDRTTFLISAIEKQHFLYEPEVYNYLQSIIDQLIAANPQRFHARPLLLIDRSPVANAYALGNNVLVVNLGLICFVQTREELALALAHELSHNLLSHPENGMKEMAEWLKSDQYKNSMKDVLDSKYGRYSRLKKVFEGYSFSRSKHQRYHESDADSLAVLLLKNSHIAFNAVYFLRLDSADMQYWRSLKRPLGDYFAAYNLSADPGWMQIHSRGLSTKTYNFADTSGIEDSLKSHPDCIQRYKATLDLSDLNAATTPIPVAVSAKATKMLIWNMFDDMTLTACLYRILQERDKGNTDGWYDFMLYNIFAGLYYQEMDMHRFNAIGIVPKEYISKEYYQLQTMLEQMPSADLGHYYNTLRQAPFWAHRPPEENAMAAFVASLSVPGDKQDKQEKARHSSAEAFINDHATSMYREFADQFKKK
jgi:hypothetical protein